MTGKAAILFNIYVGWVCGQPQHPMKYAEVRTEHRVCLNRATAHTSIHLRSRVEGGLDRGLGKLPGCVTAPGGESDRFGLGQIRQDCSTPQHLCGLGLGVG